MLEYEFSQLTQKEKYNLLIGSVIPRPVIFLTSIDKNGIVNAAPFSFFNMVSYEPAILMVSIQRKDGVMKDTTRNIIENRAVVGHIVSQEILEAVNMTSKPLPYGESEIALTNLTLVDSQLVNVPRVKEAKIAYELSLYKYDTILGDDDTVVADILYLKVLYMHVDNAVKESSHILADQLNPISRLAGDDYAKLGQKITLERAK